MAPYFERDPEGREIQVQPGTKRSFLSILHRRGGPEVEVHFESDSLAKAVVPDITVEAEDGIVTPFAIPFERQGFQLKYNGQILYDVEYRDIIDVSLTSSEPTVVSGVVSDQALVPAATDLIKPSATERNNTIKVTEPKGNLKIFADGITSHFITPDWQFAYVDIDPEGVITICYKNPRNDNLVTEEPSTASFLKPNGSQSEPSGFLGLWLIDTDVVNTLLAGANLRAIRVTASYQRIKKIETADYSDPTKNPIIIWEL